MIHRPFPANVSYVLIVHSTCFFVSSDYRKVSFYYLLALLILGLVSCLAIRFDHHLWGGRHGSWLIRSIAGIVYCVW